VRPGYSPQYDAHVQARDQAAIGMEDVTAQLRMETGISNLKLKSSGGSFFIEVPSASVRLIPSTWVKIAGRGLRYKPRQLMKLEASAAAAAADAAAVSETLWSEVVAAVSQCNKELSAAAEAASNVDVLQALAEVAGTRGHVRPIVSEGGRGAVWDVKDARHFVIENLMQKRGACFIPNSCSLTQPESVMLLSGANMGGKSTFLRQNALIAILAQIGAFVPASSATISVVDRLYCRVGALQIHCCSAFHHRRVHPLRYVTCTLSIIHQQGQATTCRLTPVLSWSRWRRPRASSKTPPPTGIVQQHHCTDGRAQTQSALLSWMNWAGGHVPLRAPP
jgi:DNA mismatch repair protein MutS